MRGVIEVAFLEAVEREYRRRYGTGDICDWFDLIGGTSTGALIAGALALRKSLPEIRDFYLHRAEAFFANRRRWSLGLAPAFDSDALEREIRQDVGDRTLGSADFQTHVAFVTKRLDTGAPWIVTNIPTSPYFEDAPDGAWIGNKHYSVARLLRAASAAPTLFSHQEVEIVRGETHGVFIDGGLSPYNDPSLALLRLARLKAFGLEWPTGPENLFFLSLGAGRLRHRARPERVRSSPAFLHAMRSMLGMITDGEQASLTMMEWMGTSPAPTWIDSEIGTFENENLAGDPLFTFLRLDLPLDRAGLAQKGYEFSRSELQLMRRIDHPKAIRPLYDLATDYIERHMDLSAWLV